MNAYSTCGGISLNCLRVMNPSLSSSRKELVSMSLVPGIRDYDVLQKAKDAYEVRIVASEGASSVRKAERMVEGLYGKDGVYDVAAVDDLLPGPSGKYRRTHVFKKIIQIGIPIGDCQRNGVVV